jgi:hypothetical protein
MLANILPNTANYLLLIIILTPVIQAYSLDTPFLNNILCSVFFTDRRMQQKVGSQHQC